MTLIGHLCESFMFHCLLFVRSGKLCACRYSFLHRLKRPLGKMPGRSGIHSFVTPGRDIMMSFPAVLPCSWTPPPTHLLFPICLRSFPGPGIRQFFPTYPPFNPGGGCVVRAFSRCDYRHSLTETCAWTLQPPPSSMSSLFVQGSHCPPGFLGLNSQSSGQSTLVACSRPPSLSNRFDPFPV